MELLSYLYDLESDLRTGTYSPDFTGQEVHVA